MKTYSNRRLNILHVGLFNKDLFSSLAKSLNFAFLYVFTLFELLDPLIEIVLASLLRHSFDFDCLFL